jgi:transketolase
MLCNRPTLVILAPQWQWLQLLTAYGSDFSALIRVAVEQAATFGWERYIGLTGCCIGMHTFGSSAPLKDLQQKFGFTPDHLLAAIKAQLQQ